MNRAAEIRSNLIATHDRIARACDSAGRSSDDITLIAVTKTFPIEDIRILVDLGVRHVGESKEQEGHGKAEQLADSALTWHFIGQIQRNKAKKIAQWAHVIHSLDRHELIPLLGQRQVMLQINLDPTQQGRGGVEPAALMDLAAEVAASELDLKGVMAVAPLGVDPAAAFADLAALSHGLVRRYPGAGSISAGMSGDLEAAIAHGATHVRLGSSILGSR